MSVREKNGRLVIDCYPHGKHGRRLQRVLPEGTSKADARAIHDSLMGMKGALPELPKDGTLRELYPRFERHVKMFFKGSEKDYASVFKNRLLPYFGKLRLSEITSDYIAAYQSKRSAEKKKNGELYSTKTINNEIMILRSLMKWGAEERLCEPLPRVRMLKYTRPLPKVLGPKDMSRIISCADDLHRPLFTLLYVLGLRFGEATALAWEDVNWSARAIIIRKAKGNKTRALPLDNDLTATLKALWENARRPARGYVFVSPRTGKRIKDIRKAIRRACKAAGIDQHVNPHLFRHSGATQTLAESGDLRAVQNLLGHASIGTTEIYTHLNLEHLRGKIVRITTTGEPMKNENNSEVGTETGGNS